MTSINIKLTLPKPLMEEAVKNGLLNEDAVSQIVQDALESGKLSKNNSAFKEQWESMTVEERRRKVNELCDRIKIDTKGHSFSRDDIYEDVNKKYDIS